MENLLEATSKFELCLPEHSRGLQISVQKLSVESEANLLSDVLVERREFSTVLKGIEFSSSSLRAFVEALEDDENEQSSISSLDRQLKIGILTNSIATLSCCVRAGNIDDSRGPRGSTTVQLTDTGLQFFKRRVRELVGAL